MTKVMLGIYDHSGNQIDEVELVRVEPAELSHPGEFYPGFLKGILADGHTCMGYADWFNRNTPGWLPLFDDGKERDNDDNTER